MSDHPHAPRQAPDKILSAIADYVQQGKSTASGFSDDAYSTARYCLLDSLGCALLALRFAECTKLLGPLVPGATLANGARVPGTAFTLDPVTAAFNIGTMIRWLDFNDTWLAAEWAHPSDNLGAILASADYIDRNRATGAKAFVLQDIFDAMIQAYEIQGVLALENAFNRVGLDHVILVRVASTAVACAMLGGRHDQIVNALSNAWLDGGALRAYRHAPNTGTRKSWAAGDATSRGVRLALMALQGEMGYPSALSTPHWGFYDTLFKGNEFSLPQPFASYVMENILFKVSYPAEFHAQTAVEAALQLHPLVKNRLQDIHYIVIETQQAGVRIIDKTGTLNNPVDRDHCLQYMVAVPLIFGRLNAADYQDDVACDPRIDRLRQQMQVRENPQYSIDYLDRNKRAIAGAVQVFFVDGSATPRVEVIYPIGHRKRRTEAIPLLMEKFKRNSANLLPPPKIDDILLLFDDLEKLRSTPLNDVMSRFLPD